MSAAVSALLDWLAGRLFDLGACLLMWAFAGPDVPWSEQP